MRFFILCFISLLFVSCSSSPSYSEQDVKEIFSGELPKQAVIIKVYDYKSVRFKLDNECFIAIYGYLNGFTKVDCEK